MRDLTQGSITGHLLGMAAFIGVGHVVQTLYFLVDLYFVSRLGPAAIAGVSSAGNVFYLVLAASQIVGVGGLALLSQAAGRKDPADAQRIFDQTMAMALLFSAITLIAGYALADILIGTLTADAETARAGRLYLHTFLPSLALIFPSMALGSALRASGVVGPPLYVQTASVLLNVILAPLLIAGWGTGMPLGVAGAGLASSIAGIFGFIALLVLFPRVQSFLRIHLAGLRPSFDIWGRIVAVGLPSAGEFFIMFVIVGVSYWAIRPFGAEAQAGFGVGARVMQSIFLPAMAIAFAAAPIAGQNFGARKPERVRETFKQTALIGTAVMFSLTILCQLRPEVLARPFAEDPRTLAVAADYLRTLSWNFVATGLAFTCSSIFQGLGDTRPSFIASVTRLATYLFPVLWLSQQAHVQLIDFWHVSVVSVLMQCVVSLLFLRHQLRVKLGPLERQEAPAVA